MSTGILGGYRPLGGQSRSSALLFGLSSRTLVALAFSFTYFLAILYCYSHSYRDPTSAFFDPVRGYDKAYSLYREEQALAFVDSHNDNSTVPRSQHPPPDNPAICLGIATVARPKTQYIQKTVGSLLDGLTLQERDSLHFVFFIAHSNTSAHPIHDDLWVQNLPDTLLDYGRSNVKQMEQIREWEVSGNYREKGFYDYAYLLNACRKTGAPYIAILEGDVLAVPGWLQRSFDAARTVDYETGLLTDEHMRASVPDERRSVKEARGIEGREVGEEDNTPSWLYIRMFWTETYLGWNNEEWPTYLFWSVAAWAVTVTTLLALRCVSPQAKVGLPNDVVLLLSSVCLPLCIALYFAAGRMTVQAPRPGIRRMDDFGCCSQGMIFRTEQVPRVVDAIERRLEGYMDMLLESLAARDGLQKWAIFPSLLQHIGGESSKGDAIADQRARMIWNFAFERYGDALEAGRSLWRR